MSSVAWGEVERWLIGYFAGGAGLETAVDLKVQKVGLTIL